MLLLVAANRSSTASDGTLMKSVAIGQSLVGGSRVIKPRLTALIGGAQENHGSRLELSVKQCDPDVTKKGPHQPSPPL